MDISGIAQLIGSLGFPIAACIYLFYSMEKERDAHKEEMNKITEALNNNTLVMQQLIDSLTSKH